MTNYHLELVPIVESNIACATPLNKKIHKTQITKHWAILNSIHFYVAKIQEKLILILLSMFGKWHGAQLRMWSIQIVLLRPFNNNTPNWRTSSIWEPLASCCHIQSSWYCLQQVDIVSYHKTMHLLSIASNSNGGITQSIPMLRNYDIPPLLA
jgi:hypothetical protein